MSDRPPVPPPISLEAARRKKKAAGPGQTRSVSPGPKACRVVSLGHRGGTFYFLDVQGQERSLTSRQLGNRTELSALFVGDLAWLLEKFPRKQIKREVVAGETVETETHVGFHAAQAGEWLMRQCGRAGIYGDRIVIRRSGIWAAADGSPLVHCGDTVLGHALQKDGSVTRVQHAPGFRIGNTVFGAAELTPRPVAPCGPGPARALQQGFKELWDWAEPGAEILAVGMVGAGYLGAAARWRPNLFLLGDPGCGKSQLLQVMRAASPVHFYSNDTTKEGLAQAVNGRALPIFVDEASDRVDQHGAQVLMDLVLAATGAEGAKVRRGTADGRGRSVEVVGCIAMASVAPPEMQAQHAARFTMLELRKPGAGDDNKAPMEALAEAAGNDGPAMWGRALAGWGRWTEALAAYRLALGNCGCAAREMDQVGALLASWWVLTEDGVPAPRDALAGVVAVTAYVRRADEVEQTGRAQMALMHLLSCRVQRNHTTDMVPVAELLEQALRAPDEFDAAYAEAAGHLARHGMRVVRADQETDRQGRPVPRMGRGGGVWLSNTAKPLADLFRGTPYAGIRWRFALLALESARRSVVNVRIGSVATYALWISEKDLFPEFQKVD